MSMNMVYMYIKTHLIYVYTYNYCDQIRADFVLLDENQSSTIGFIEVCICP
jgi:hypothetical protein